MPKVTTSRWHNSSRKFGIFPLSISAVHGIMETISELGGVLMVLQLHDKFGAFAPSWVKIHAFMLLLKNDKSLFTGLKNDKYLLACISGSWY